MTRLDRRIAPLVGGLVALMMLAVGMFACTEADDDPTSVAPPSLMISDAVVAVPAGANTAVYLTIDNSGAGGDRLLSATSTIGARVELHETRADDDGLMRMHHVDAIELPAETEVHLEPGGFHIMVFDVVELSDGDLVEIELEFERSGPVTLEAVVATYTSIHGD
jgi:periplasmic copper chaperone A